MAGVAVADACDCFDAAGRDFDWPSVRGVRSGARYRAVDRANHINRGCGDLVRRWSDTEFSRLAGRGEGRQTIGVCGRADGLARLGAGPALWCGAGVAGISGVWRDHDRHRAYGDRALVAQLLDQQREAKALILGIQIRQSTLSTVIEKVFQIILPVAVPYIFTGMRLSLGIAWLVIVAAEMLTGGIGIGFWIWDEYNNLAYHNIIIGIILVGLVGFLLDVLMGKVADYFDYRKKILILT